MEIIDNVFKEKMDEFNKENELGLTDYECSCYANCFKVLCELTNNKLGFDDIAVTYDFFDDVATGKRPDIMIMTSKYFDIYKLSKRYSTTKNLTEDERRIFAFGLYYAICIKGFDEEKQEMTWTLKEYTSVDVIKKQYEWHLENQSEKFVIPDPISDYTKEDYGLSIENPVEVNGIRTIYDYLECLELADGTQVVFERDGSDSNSKDIIVDEFKVMKKGLFGMKKQISSIYVSGYGFENSDHVPKGFKFKEM